MLKKVVSVRNVGKLRDLSPDGDVEFRKLTLIWADNGVGKTTLCDLLRSLATGNLDVVRGRQTLGQSQRSEAELRLGGSNYRLKADGWTATVPDLRIFDASFVHNNVFEGDSIEVAHRRNLHNVILGEKGVLLAKAIEATDAESKRTASALAAAQAQIQEHIGLTASLAEFMGLAENTSVESDLRQTMEDLAALENIAEVRTKPLPQRLELPSFPSEIEIEVARPVSDIDAETEEVVRRHLRRCHSTPNERWLAVGVTLETLGLCPYCGQSLENSPVAPALRMYFSEKYKLLKQAIDSLLGLLNNFKFRLRVREVDQHIALNKELAQYWAKLSGAPVEVPSIDVTAICDAGLHLANEADALIGDRQNSLLAPIEIPLRFREAKAAFESQYRSVERYNASIARIAEVAHQLQLHLDEKQLQPTRDRLARLLLVQKRWTERMRKNCENLVALKQKKDNLAQRKATERDALEAFSKDVVAKYEKTINALLASFGAGFRIGKARNVFYGGTPGTTFALVVEGATVELTGADTPRSEPSLGNTLSAGDRSALAFAFFLAQLVHDTEIGKRIVVLDDPFTSQDGSRRNWTAVEIRKLVHSATQVVVLSHDPHFLADLAGDFDSGTQKCLQLVHVGKKALLREWDALEACLPQYVKDHKLVLAFSNAGLGDPEKVRERLRPLLEEHLVLTFPEQFGPKDTLGEMIASIRNSGAQSPLAVTMPLLDDLAALNDYALGVQHRERVPGASRTDLAELSAYATRALTIVRRG